MTATKAPSRASASPLPLGFRRHWHGAGQALEAAVHRGNVAEAVRWEDFIVEHGRALDAGWLIATYHALKVPPQFRRVTEEAVEARALAEYGDAVTTADVLKAARAARRDYLAHVRWNSEHGLIPPGWRVLDGDPEAERV